jgi:hypothetical protein
VVGVDIVQSWVVSSGRAVVCRLQRSFLGPRTKAWISALEASPRRQLLAFLAIYVGVLATFATATGVDSLHFDMTEMWAWGKEIQLGYGKHPPLSAWIVGLWFSVMPRSNWAFHLVVIALAPIHVRMGTLTQRQREAGYWRTSVRMRKRPRCAVRKYRA